MLNLIILWLALDRLIFLLKHDGLGGVNCPGGRPFSVTLRPEVLVKGGGAVPRMFPLYFAYAVERMCNESIV